MAASFSNAAYERLPLEEDEMQTPVHGGGGGGGGGSMESPPMMEDNCRISNKLCRLIKGYHLIFLVVQLIKGYHSMITSLIGQRDDHRFDHLHHRS
ncbi:hypothetical protein Bca52824_096813 [Brassica carinata]|uniref:Uncharacterized protein n=1 Tax=Brassica carinata TaxID=52824 RepID=A0A8X7NZ77_BRACI|nr:hypothetical protein Bca52824_096813 [Brassica carinata]